MSEKILNCRYDKILKNFDNYASYTFNLSITFEKSLDTAWKEAEKLRTKTSYTTFLKRFPNSHLSSVAKNRLNDIKKLKEENSLWVQTMKVDTIEAYETYLNKYDYDALHYDEAREKLISLYSIYVYGMDYSNFPKFKESILKRWNGRVKDSNPAMFNKILDEDLHLFESIKYIKLCNTILNNSNMNKFKEVKEDMLSSASISSHLNSIKEDYESFLNIQESINNILNMIEEFDKHEQYTKEYRKQYIHDVFERVNDPSSSYSYPEERLEKEVNKLKCLLEFKLRDCDNNKINFDIVKEEFNKFIDIKNGTRFTSKFEEIGEKLYFTEIISLEFENTPNPIINLLNPFHSVKVYIGTHGVMFYNPKLVSYESISSIFYKECDISYELENHQYLTKLEKKCKDIILNLAKFAKP